MNPDRTAGGFVLSETTRTSRRGLLARLTAMPAILGLVIFEESETGRAKKGKGKRKHRRHKRKKRQRKNQGGSSGGSSGGYAADGEEQAFLNMINSYRAQNGLGALALQGQLGAAADHHSQDMANKNYFAHSILENVNNFGYSNWRSLGENIYAGGESASGAMDAWKNSPGHNQNMLDGSWTEIGIGRAYNSGSTYGWYWTTTFGSR